MAKCVAPGCAEVTREGCRSLASRSNCPTHVRSRTQFTSAQVAKKKTKRGETERLVKKFLPTAVGLSNFVGHHPQMWRRRGSAEEELHLVGQIMSGDKGSF